VPALAAFLRRHLGWLAVHPAADDAATEIDALLRRALAVSRGGHGRQFALDHCGAA
jgi:hypothetical protein